MIARHLQLQKMLDITPRKIGIRLDFDDDTDMIGMGLIQIGHLSKEKIKCNKPNCKCKSDPEYFHGPYYYFNYRLYDYDNMGQTVWRKKKRYIPLHEVESFKKRLRFVKNNLALEKVYKQAVNEKAKQVLGYAIW